MAGHLLHHLEGVAHAHIQRHAEGALVRGLAVDGVIHCYRDGVYVRAEWMELVFVNGAWLLT